MVVAVSYGCIGRSTRQASTARARGFDRVRTAMAPPPSPVRWAISDLGYPVQGIRREAGLQPQAAGRGYSGVHLTKQGDDPASGAAAYAAWNGDVPVGSLVAHIGTDRGLVVTVDWLLLAGRAQATELLATLTELAGRPGAPALVVDTVDRPTR